MAQNDPFIDDAKPTVPVRLKIASQLSGLATVCAFVEGACKAFAPHLTAQEIHDLELAVNEACSNIIRHAYRYDPEQVIWISADCVEECLVFTAIDQGEAAQDALAVRQIGESRPEEPQEHGYGVLLIRQVMDEVEYTRDPKRGNVLVMKKKVPAHER